MSEMIKKNAITNYHWQLELIREEMKRGAYQVAALMARELHGYVSGLFWCEAITDVEFFAMSDEVTNAAMLTKGVI